MARAVLKPKSGTDLDKLSKTLRELRETQSETRQALYDNIFYYLNVSEKKDTYIAEAFLIKTANRLFGEFTTDADTALMALGLLEGYDYNSAKNCKQRRIKFLKESMYLAKKGKTPYLEADEELQSHYEDSLRATDEPDLLLEMANFMLKPENHSQGFISDINKYIDDGVAVFPIPGYIKRKPLKNRIKKAVITFSRSKGELFTASSDIVINKDGDYEMAIDLPTDVDFHKKRKISTPTAVIVVLLFTSLSITTISYTHKDMSVRTQETDTEYQTRDDIIEIYERANKKLNAKPAADSFTENNYSVASF
ncbi:hypothetical protein [Parabacteroides goldsteinii]|uniref:hypothetical protein n=1 Tax=Parabacteroides goldsteinii TaxID=328812 RepID=UPI002592617F|nr:hypothetical protein [Parabacteroides goldsteinii]